MSSDRGDGRGGGILGALSRPPEKRWPDGVLYHGARILLLLAVALFVTLLFPPEERADVARYEEGTVADETVQADLPFAVPKSEAELEQDRTEAAAAVPPTFEYRPEAADSMRARLTRFFERVDRAAEQRGGGGVQEMLSEAGIAATPNQLDLLIEPESRERLQETALRVTRELMPRGVVDASQAEEITTNRITVRQAGTEERSISVDSLIVGREFLDRSVAMLGAVPPDMEDLFRLILIRFMEPTYLVDRVATELDKEAARRSVPTTKENVLAGQVIVRDGDRIGEADVERLNAYAQALQNEGITVQSAPVVGPVLGAGLLHVMVLAIFGILLFSFQPDVYQHFRWLLLLAGLTVAYFGAGAVIAAEQWPEELLPVAFVTLAVAVLWDGRMALVLGMALAVLTGLLAPFADLRTLTLVLMGGASAALAVRVIRRRAQTWVFVAVISASYAATILAFAVVRGSEPSDTLVSLAWAVGNATASAILAMGFVPVFEWITGITTDQTLLEWADPNRPLLKRLSMEAPGTYAHTINVANLAEAAANAIDANGLLCRVGVYYHDVGKMLKPQYFVENQPGGQNPHDRLKPDTSASIVREHVIEGVRLAREAGVPEVVVDFISEHHGDQQIGFFYEKAVEESEDEEELEPDQFRYPGPRPRSKETAIVMLADSVESATRALQEPTAERTRELVESIVDSKIEAGQLDEAPLTLQEIARLKEQLVKILSGMYHHRIDYPGTKHLTDAPAERAVAETASSEALPDAGGADGGEGEEEEKAASAGGAPGDVAARPESVSGAAGDPDPEE